MKQTKRNGKLVRAKRTSIVCWLQIHEKKEKKIHENTHTCESGYCSTIQGIIKCVTKTTTRTTKKKVWENERERKQANMKQHRFRFEKMFYDLLRLNFWRILFSIFLWIECILALQRTVLKVYFLPAQCSRICGSEFNWISAIYGNCVERIS